MEQILTLIEQYGYLVVFFGVMLESTGVPLPGETILIASGVLAQRGLLDVADAIVSGILGAVVGDQIGYWVGREGGRPFVLRWGRYVRITKATLQRAGLPKSTRFHDLRHTCATLLLGQGVNPKYVQELLGHASIALTLDTYSHVLPGMDGGIGGALKEALD